MEYFVAYDMHDNIIAYINNLLELSLFTGLRIYDINYKFKEKDYILCDLNGERLQIYKFY